MKVLANEAAELLKNSDNILILSHKNPDGDTLGSAYALLYTLYELKKNARVECSDKIPSQFEYLVGDIKPKEFEPELIVAVDIASETLLGGALEKYADRIDLCIDHHPSNTGFAKKTLLEASAAANCENIYEVIAAMQVDITKHIADCIYTGIVTDSGCFRFSNTTEKTHLIAAKMIGLGADHAVINRSLFETKSKNRMSLELDVLNSMEFFLNDKVACIVISQAVIEKTGADETELDGISAIPRTIEGVHVGITLREKADGSYKASLRTTDDIDAGELCAQFGGGGHKRAAGCVLTGDLQSVKKQLLNAIKALYD